MRPTSRLVLSLLVLAPAAWAAQPDSPIEGSGRPTPLEFTLGEVKLSINGRAQTQAAMYVGDDARLADGVVAEEYGFRLRRARFGAGFEYKGLTIGVETDLLESDGSALHEAFVGYGYEWDKGGISVQAGVIKTPMSRSTLLSSETVQNGERSLVIRGLAPEQQLGVVMGGDVWDHRVRLLIGGFNGMNRAATFASGWEHFDPKVGNRFGGYAISTRLDIEPIPGAPLLGDGVADLGKRKAASFGFGGGFLLNKGESLGSLAWSADMAFKGWGVGFLAEWIEVRTEPVEKPTTGSDSLEIISRGATVQLGYTICKDLLEISARFDYLDQNTELENEGDIIAAAGTISHYLFDGHLKVQLDYEHRTERHGQELENDVFMGSVEGRF